MANRNAKAKVLARLSDGIMHRVVNELQANDVVSTYHKVNESVGVARV